MFTIINNRKSEKKGGDIHHHYNNTQHVVMVITIQYEYDNMNIIICTCPSTDLSL